MSFTKTGFCTQCGGPIYSPRTWNESVPPPSYHTCPINTAQPGHYQPPPSTTVPMQPYQWDYCNNLELNEEKAIERLGKAFDEDDDLKLKNDNKEPKVDFEERLGNLAYRLWEMSDTVNTLMSRIEELEEKLHQQDKSKPKKSKKRFILED